MSSPLQPDTVVLTENVFKATLNQTKEQHQQTNMSLPTVTLCFFLFQKPFHFLPEYKNPCWKTPGSKLPISCFPYFYLVGAPKSGTTDVFTRLQAHPDFAKPPHKEPHWITRRRFGKHYMNISVLIKLCNISVIPSYILSFFGHEFDIQIIKFV